MKLYKVAIPMDTLEIEADGFRTDVDGKFLLFYKYNTTGGTAVIPVRYVKIDIIYDISVEHYPE